MRRPGGALPLLAAVRRAVLLAVVAGVPLVFLWDVTEQPFAVPKLALLAVGVAVAAALRGAEVILGTSARGLSALAAPASFVVVPVALAWLASDYREWALWGAYARYEGLLPTLLVVAAGVLVADAFRPPSRAVAWAFVGAAAGVGLYTLLQSVGLDPLDVPVGEYAPSTIGHSNFVGGFLAIALPLGLVLWNQSNGAARAAAMAATIAVGIGVLMSFSQGGWLAAVGGVAVFAGAVAGARRPWLAGAGWIAAAAVAAVSAGIVVFSLVQPFHPVVPDTVRARGLWWREAAAMGAESPVWGRGPNVFAIEGPHHRNPEDGLAHDRDVADVPHSVPLSLFANHGLLGLGGFLALVVWTVRRGLAVRASPLAAAYAAGAAAYFIQSISSIDMTALTLALWVCVAGLAGSRNPDPGPASPPSRARAAVAAVVVVAVSGAALWWGVRFVSADARVNSALEAFDAERDAEGLAMLGDVVDEHPIERYRHLYGSMLGKAALRQGADGGDEIERMTEAFEYLDELPDVGGLATYANHLHQWSIFDPAVEAQALEQLRRLLQLDSYSPTARVWTAEALMHLGRPDEAVEVVGELLTIAREKPPAYGGLHPELWGAYAIAAFLDGDAQTAAETLEEGRDLTGARAATDCHVLVAQELLRTGGRTVDRGDLVRSSPGLMLCPPATVALLPGFDPGKP